MVELLASILIPLFVDPAIVATGASAAIPVTAN